MFDEKNQNMSMDSTFAEHKTLIDPMWLVNQLKREDSAERMAAFHESKERDNAHDSDLFWYTPLSGTQGAGHIPTN